MGMLVGQDVIDAQVARLSGRYPGASYDPGSRTVLMPFRLDATFDDRRIVEDFILRIVLHDGYPHTLPSVYEESGRISDEFEHRYVDGSLCFGVPGEILMGFPGGIDLVGLIEGPVTSCLYSAAFLQRYGRYPFGERSHGMAGVLEYYRELFEVDDDLAALRLMRLVAEGRGYRGSDKCPCGSGKQIWVCHGKLLSELSSDDCASAIDGDYRCLTSEARVRRKRAWVSSTVKASSSSMWRTRP